MAIGPSYTQPGSSLSAPAARVAANALAQSLPREFLSRNPKAPGLGADSEAKLTVLRPALLPPAASSVPPADDRFQVSRALVGMRESRAMASLAADLAAELAVARPGEVETLRTRLREVVEIGSARDTAGPLASLYAAARRDPATPLARLLRDGSANAATTAEAVRDLRMLDERFAARDFALTPPSAVPTAATQAKGVDLTA